MNFNLPPLFWDIALVVAVTGMATVVSYTSSPKVKGFMLNIPLPFTIACMSLGKPVDITHLSGLALLLVYTFGVYFLHIKGRVPILIAIVIAALTYSLSATWLAPVLPRSEAFFWSLAAAIAAIGFALLAFLPRKHEEGHKTTLPFYIKIPIILLVVVCLLLAKKYLQGFMTMFPMVGLVTSYEARKCLWSICRVIPMATFIGLGFILIAKSLEPSWGMGVSLLVAWGLFALAFPWVLKWRRKLA